MKKDRVCVCTSCGLTSYNTPARNKRVKKLFGRAPRTHTHTQRVVPYTTTTTTTTTRVLGQHGRRLWEELPLRRVCVYVRAPVGSRLFFTASRALSLEHAFPPCRPTHRVLGRARARAHTRVATTNGSPRAAAAVGCDATAAEEETILIPLLLLLLWFSLIPSPVRTPLSVEKKPAVPSRRRVYVDAGSGGRRTRTHFFFCTGKKTEKGERETRRKKRN